MKLKRLSVLFLAAILAACSVMAPSTTRTQVPLSPAQYLESAFQWLETHAMMKDNVDWSSLRNEAAGTVALAQTAADTYPVICKAIRELKDGNAWLLVPGLGVPNFYTGYHVLYPENTIIIRIEADSPAEQAGLPVGSRILQVNGHPPIPYQEMDAYPPCNSQEIDTSTREQLLLDQNGKLLEIEVERIQFTAGMDPYIPPEGRRIGEDERGIGYIELTLESGTHARYPTDVQNLMRNHDNTPVCGWILDLRRNPGGDLWSYIAAVGPILGEGDLGGFEYLNGRREMWTYRNGEVLWNNEYRDESEIDGSIYTPKRVTPVALLTGPATQAAGELMLVAFQGRPDVRSFGEPTRGLPTLVTHTELSDGSTLFVSGANSFDRNGTIYSGPLQPDVFVQTDWSSFGTGQDPVVQAAVDWLHAQSSCTG